MKAKTIIYTKNSVYFECLLPLDKLGEELARAKKEENSGKLLKLPCILTLQDASVPQWRTRNPKDFYIDALNVSAIIDIESDRSDMVEKEPKENIEKEKENIKKDLKSKKKK